MTPEPLHLELTLKGTERKENQALIIDVEVTATQNGNYDIKTTDITFKIDATKVIVNDKELPGFTPTTFEFQMAKAK